MNQIVHNKTSSEHKT